MLESFVQIKQNRSANDMKSNCCFVSVSHVQEIIREDKSIQFRPCNNQDSPEKQTIEHNNMFYIYICLRGREKIYYRNRLPGLWRPEVSQSNGCKLENQEYDCAIH